MPELKNLADNLMIDRTPEALRIQIVDQDKQSKFPLGSVPMADTAKKLMALVARVVARLPNKLSITGRTDVRAYAAVGNYGNWELSADRANASRRELVADGLAPEPFVAPEYYRGVVTRRIFAYLIDLLVLCLLLVLVWTSLASLTVLSLGLLSPIWFICPFVPLAYHTLLLSGHRSATIGMRAFKIELRSWTGERPTFAQALVQTVLFYLTTAATFSLVLLVALFNRRRRTLHDMVAGTVVILRFPRPAVLTPESH